MKRQRISISGRFTTLAYSRVPFDIITNVDGFRECWVRYRGGRLFVREVPNEACWQAFRFEPKHGNAYEV